MARKQQLYGTTSKVATFGFAEYFGLGRLEQYIDWINSRKLLYG
jgi:hypothetical protein